MREAVVIANIEMEPGETLTGLVKRTLRNGIMFHIETPLEITTVYDALRE
jgi:hypothetical protein